MQWLRKAPRPSLKKIRSLDGNCSFYDWKRHRGAFSPSQSHLPRNGLLSIAISSDLKTQDTQRRHFIWVTMPIMLPEGLKAKKPRLCPVIIAFVLVCLFISSHRQIAIHRHQIGQCDDFISGEYPFFEWPQFTLTVHRICWNDRHPNDTVFPLCVFWSTFCSRINDRKQFEQDQNDSFHWGLEKEGGKPGAQPIVDWKSHRTELNIGLGVFRAVLVCFMGPQIVNRDLTSFSLWGFFPLFALSICWSLGKIYNLFEQTGRPGEKELPEPFWSRPPETRIELCAGQRCQLRFLIFPLFCHQHHVSGLSKKVWRSDGQKHYCFTPFCTVRMQPEKMGNIFFNVDSVTLHWRQGQKTANLWVRNGA